MENMDILIFDKPEPQKNTAKVTATKEAEQKAAKEAKWTQQKERKEAKEAEQKAAKEAKWDPTKRKEGS